MPTLASLSLKILMHFATTRFLCALTTNFENTWQGDEIDNRMTRRVFNSSEATMLDGLKMQNGMTECRDFEWLPGNCLPEETLARRSYCIEGVFICSRIDVYIHGQGNDS